MVKWIVMCAAPVALAGGAYLHGPIQRGTVYAKPASEVVATLESMTLPTYFGTALSTVDGGSTRMTVPGESVIYLFQARGGQAAKFVVTYKPVDAGHTRVATRMVLGDEAERLLKTEIMPGPEEFVTVGTAAMNEQIDARLSGRPVNEDVAKRAMMQFAVAHMGDIQKGVAAKMDESIKAAEAMETDRTSSRGAVIIPGQPMSDPSRAGR